MVQNHVKRARRAGALFVGLVAAVLASCAGAPGESPGAASTDANVAGPTSRVGRGNLEYVGSAWKSGQLSDVHFLFYWNQVTPEDAGLWGNVESDRDEMEWDDLDDALLISRVASIPARLHALVSHEDQPDWIADLEDEDQLEQVDEWFAAAGERYEGVAFVEVVHEPLTAAPPYADALGGAGATGYDWVLAAFELARDYFPGSSLSLTERGVLTGGRLDEYLRLVLLLHDRGLVDSVGVQAHSLEAGSLEPVRRTLDRLGETGLPVYVTELDVDMRDDRDHERRIAELVTLFAEHPAVRGVTFWGYREDRIERTNAYLLRADGSQRPAMEWLIREVEIPLGE